MAAPGESEVPKQEEPTAPTTDPFEKLYRKPDIPEMRKLTPTNFERFVAQVLSHAGYQVRHTGRLFRRGVDLELLPNQDGTRRKLGGVECKRYNRKLPVGRDPVQKLAGAAATRGGLPGYLITTSTFTEPAKEEARTRPNIQLIDGEHLVRYINYVRGSVGHSHSTALTTIPPSAALDADRLLERLPAQSPPILVIANNKGGVGKTTTARFLGLGLAAKGSRVLLVDLDAQANLSEFILGTAPDQIAPPTLAEYFGGECTLSQTVHPSPTQPLLAILPSHQLLSHYDTGGFGRPDVELKFVTNLYETFAPPQGYAQFDWIILDTPPNVSLFTRAALAAADHVLVPARARDSSVRGTLNMLRAWRAMGALMGRTPVLVGCLLMHWGVDNASELAEAHLRRIFEQEGSQVLDPHIPMSAAIESNPSAATAARRAYDELVLEVMNHVVGPR
jgi:chromosome partitioning protein